MPNYQLTKKAVSDLASIWRYTTKEWSEQQAEKYYDLILDSCDRISQNPRIGKSYEGVTKDLLGLRVNKHIIFYRILPNQPIEITRILHAHMDLKKRIKK